MKFAIDIRYIIIQLLKVIVCYLIGVVIVLYSIEPKDPEGFILASSLACFVVYFGLNFPRKICVCNGIISFNKVNSYERCKIKITDIENVRTDSYLYNTLIIKTKFGDLYRIHPQKIKTLETIISKHRNP